MPRRKKHSSSRHTPTQAPGRDRVNRLPPESEQHTSIDTATQSHTSSIGEVDDYLWRVYQRTPVKTDGGNPHGKDFAWKDAAAAKRLGMSVKQFAVQGMRPAFRELLYKMGKDMDDAGLHWSFSAGFRDNYRQSIAEGFKASAGGSKHGGTGATKGYGDGQALDITGDATAGGKTTSEKVWRWLDAHGRKYGLYRPIPNRDEPHTVATAQGYVLAQKFQTERARLAALEEKKNAPVQAAANLRSGASQASGPSALFARATAAAVTPQGQAQDGYVMGAVKAVGRFLTHLAELQGQAMLAESHIYTGVLGDKAAVRVTSTGFASGQKPLPRASLALAPEVLAQYQKQGKIPFAGKKFMGAIVGRDLSGEKDDAARTLFAAETKTIQKRLGIAPNGVWDRATHTAYNRALAQQAKTADTPPPPAPKPGKPGAAPPRGRA